MSRISEIAREMKTWWSDEGSDIEVQDALDEIIRLDDAEQTEPTISKMEQVDKDINVRSKDEPKTEYERASEQREHDILYEPTYNPEDGSM